MARFGKPDNYWKELAEMLEKKRDKMAKFLSEVGMSPTIPDGGYFMIADFSALGNILYFDYIYLHISFIVKSIFYYACFTFMI